MFRLSYWKLFSIVLLALVPLAACAVTEENTASSSHQPLVAFEFTPVPTSTQSSAEQDVPSVNLSLDEYSVQMDNHVTSISIEEDVDAEIVLVADSAEISPPAIETSLLGERSESLQTSKRVDLTNRETLVENITQSRNAISNLAYTINIASGVGMISCINVVNYYEQISGFEQYNVSPELHIANESYSKALNTITGGVEHLYDFCTTFLAESAYNDEIRIREIQPAAIWENAVTESNVSIRSAENSVGWLNGDARLLSTVYDGVRQNLGFYQQALNNAGSVTACAEIRSAFEKLVINTIVLDIGNSTTSTSYISYRLAVDSINKTGIGLYEFCDIKLGGAGQMAEGGSQALPQGLIDTALIGQQQAMIEIDMAYYYITPPTSEPMVESQGADKTAQAVWNTNDEVAMPLVVRVVSIHQSSQPHLWEIVVSLEPNGGTMPYSLLSAGTLNDNQTVTVLQTCDRNFRDKVSIRDAAGLLFRSEKIEVQRSGVCGL